MRRTVAALAAALGLTGGLLPGGPASGSPVPASPPEQALDQVAALLTGTAPTRRPSAGAVDATLAMRDLFAALPRLTGSDRGRAESLLARPTDRGSDPYGDGYTTRSRRTCATRICVHWVPTTRDAPPSRRWVATTMRVLRGVWATEVGTLGYRAPVRDGSRGGDDRFDVYLKELGSQGLYGYCAPERRLRDYRRVASGYCVLDDDFARSQFGRAPTKTLRVTAAHEFFHAVQFGYDWGEDRWLMESTSTWMEEQYADAVNDSRQYLRHGQLGRPDQPLDTSTAFHQYGNWVFFQYLGQRFGADVVRRTWRQAGQFRGDGQTYSSRAVARALPRRLGFGALYAQFAMANTTPGLSYPEGGSWGAPAVASSRTMGREDAAERTRIDHLAAKPYRLRPARELRRRVWRMRVTVDGPARETGPVAGVVRVPRSGQVVRTGLRLDADGRGTVTVPFNRRQTSALFVVLGNASLRFTCNRGTDYSCHGTSRDDDRRFRLRLEVVRRG
ncbi:MAG TPA: MXAN_6640 family putative metalloprotease [Nocardioides sp.]|nr:MXAN_6640 family putative metalloprotease [Nocardioides sp.]